jgi:hypothetical protein
LNKNTFVKKQEKRKTQQQQQPTYTHTNLPGLVVALVPRLPRIAADRRDSGNLADHFPLGRNMEGVFLLVPIGVGSGSTRW